MNNNNNSGTEGILLLLGSLVVASLVAFWLLKNIENKKRLSNPEPQAIRVHAEVIKEE